MILTQLSRSRLRIHQYYVDSVGGNDSNDGLTEATPLKTLAAVPRVSSSVIFLKRGSHWRETLGLSAYTGISVIAYGAGDRPLIDCSDIASNANFSKTGGYTNIYQVSMTHSLSAADKFSVFESGARLTRATSMANCDATPGSYYAATPGASPQLIYVHPKSSTNPTSDGKLYEVTVRGIAISSSTYGSIIGIHTRRNGNNNGSLISKWYAENCLAEDGTKHNFWVEGIARDCIAQYAENPASYGDCTLFVTYRDSGSGMTTRYINCEAIGNARNGNQIGYYFHTAGGANPNMEAVIYDNCSASYLAEGFAGANCKKRILYKCSAELCNQSITSAGVEKNYVIGGFYSGWSLTDVYAVRHYNQIASASLYIRGATFIARATSGSMIVGGFPLGLDMENCDFIFANATGSPQVVFESSSATAQINNRKNVFVSCSQSWGTVAGATLTSDNNCIYPSTTDVKWNGTTYTTVAAYKTASGLDANSITTDPQIVGGAANAVPVYAPESGVWAIGAGSGVLTESDLLNEYNMALAAA